MVTATDSTDDLISLRRTIVRMILEAPAAIQRKDAAAMAEWFASDALLFAQNLEAIEGKEAIRRFYADAFLPGINLHDGAFTSSDVHTAGDLGFETGTSLLTWHAAGQPAVTLAGKYLTVWKRQPNGSWRIWRHAPSSNT